MGVPAAYHHHDRNLAAEVHQTLVTLAPGLERRAFAHDDDTRPVGWRAFDPLHSDVRGPYHDFALSYRGQDPRAIASLWTQWYIVTYWPAIITAALCFDRAADYGKSPLLLDPNGCPQGLLLQGHATIAPEQTLEVLVREHAPSVITPLCEISGVSPRVPWSNATHVLRWLRGVLSPTLPPSRLDSLDALLHTPQWPDGERNPLFVPDPANRQHACPNRRTCCLRYRLDGFDYCPGCPIESQ